MENKEFYTIMELTEILKVKRLTIYRWLDAGKLHATKVGKQWRVSPQDLQEFLDKCNKQ